LGNIGFTPNAAVILLSSARPLLDLKAILASHALIHTAEGEFFRQAFRSAFETLKIPVTGIRARDLDDALLKHSAKPQPQSRKESTAWAAAWALPGPKTKRRL